MNPIIIIPAYNPPDLFPQLINRLNEITTIPIIVIDDGSIPLISLKNSNLTLLRNSKNRGKGYSLVKAFHYTYNRGYSHAVTLDADFQHDPQLVDSFIKIHEDTSIVLGRRDFNKEMPIHRRLSNKITSSIISYICGKRILDSQCGYRRYKLSDVCSEKFIENGFQFESEVLIKLLIGNKTSLQHLTIPTIYRKENTSMNNFWDTIRFIRLIIRTIFKYSDN